MQGLDKEAQVDALTFENFLRAQHDFARDVERAAARYADRLATTFEADEQESAVRVRGERQAEILAIPDLFTTRGLSVGEISRTINYDEANCHTAVKTLEKQGLLEVAFEGTPRRYRLALQYRRDKILRAARVIPEGRWTAYGEVGIAATGNKVAARAVARSAAYNPAFPAPWRVINADGSIPEGWHGYGGGPEKCRELLEAESVTFEDGRADPAKKMRWEEIEAALLAADAEDAGDHAA
jgi:alkylated DNA nucleotide flippase Atl1